jgi:hypothetical protein
MTNELLPSLTVKFRPDGQEMTCFLDTGASESIVSYKWLVEHGVVKQGPIFQLFHFAGRPPTHGHVLDLNFDLIGTNGGNISNVVGRFIALEDWSSFAAIGHGHQGVVGRNILSHTKVSVEIDKNGKTKITNATWETFESEVADYFRALGLEVKKNQNVAGTQIDMVLTETTKTGKHFLTIVECKFHERPIGTQYVRQFAAVSDFIKKLGLAEHAILVSASGFTKDASLAADAAKIELLELPALQSKARSPAKSNRNVREHHHEKSELRDRRTPAAFVIMPFTDEFRDIYILGIRETAASCGFVCRRADEVEFNGRIMDQISELIRDSDVIIAEVTNQNANVYYELGWAHALGKGVVLCTRNIGQVPFDTRDLNHIVYTDIVDLRAKLSRRLKTLLIPQE